MSEHEIEPKTDTTEQLLDTEHLKARVVKGPGYIIERSGEGPAKLFNTYWCPESEKNS